MVDEKDNSFGWMVALAIFLIFITVGYGLYAFLNEPYRVADLLRERLDGIDSVSDDYRDGWNDCISYYLNQIYGPKNMTSDRVRS